MGSGETVIGWEFIVVLRAESGNKVDAGTCVLEEVPRRGRKGERFT